MKRLWTRAHPVPRRAREGKSAHGGGPDLAEALGIAVGAGVVALAIAQGMMAWHMLVLTVERWLH